MLTDSIFIKSGLISIMLLNKELKTVSFKLKKKNCVIIDAFSLTTTKVVQQISVIRWSKEHTQNFKIVEKHIQETAAVATGTLSSTLNYSTKFCEIKLFGV